VKIVDSPILDLVVRVIAITMAIIGLWIDDIPSILFAIFLWQVMNFDASAVFKARWEATATDVESGWILTVKSWSRSDAEQTLTGLIANLGPRVRIDVKRI
jgi:hypothetical protein